MATKRKRKLGNPAAAAAAASAAKKAGPAAKKINDDTKGALSWVLVGGAVVGVYFLYKLVSAGGKVGDLVGSVADTASSIFDGVTNNIENPEDATNTPLTISNATAKAKASILYESMASAGTDFPRIKGTLTGVTKADFVLISNEFGTPRYGGFGASTWPAPQRNLVYWLATELDNNELNQIRQMIPGLF